MDIKITEYVNNCRCCFKSLKSVKKSFQITKETEECFLKFVGIQLKNSSLYSTKICEICKKDLNEIATKCEKFAENQNFLYQLAVSDSKSKETEDSCFQNTENKHEIQFKTEIEAVTLDPVDIVESRLEEVVVKVEQTETEDCVYDEELLLEVLDYPENNSTAHKSNSKVVCKKCGEILDSQQTYKSHLNNHKTAKKIGLEDYDENVQKPCRICQKMLFPKERNAHMRKHQNELNKMSGHIKTKRKIRKIRNRIPKSMEDPNKKSICRKCGIILENKEEYVEHLSEHQRLRDQGIDEYCENIPKPCPFCGIMLLPESRHSHYKKHENEINNVVFHCDYCGFNTPSRRHFDRHMITHMSRASLLKYQCQFCSEMFTSFGNRQYHIKKYHLNEPKKIFSCQICGKMFNSAAGEYEHRFKHQNLKIPCEQCGETFPSTTKMKIHFKKVHGPKTTCEICGILTTSIQMHIRKKHKTYKCDFEGCGKIFNSESTFDSHKKAKHSEETSVRCEYCDKECGNEFYLSKHIKRVHKKVKDKICQVSGCGYASDRREYLRLHYNNHKGIDTDEKTRLINELYGK